MLDAHTHKLLQYNEEKFMVAIFLQKLQFILKVK
jgi:hypothetical protein